MPERLFLQQQKAAAAAVHGSNDKSTLDDDVERYNYYYYCDQTFLAAVNEVDETISGPFFRMSLPTCLEAVYSFPANIFGTSSCLIIGPLWIALLALLNDTDSCRSSIIVGNHHSKTFLLKCVTVSLTAIFIALWAAFQMGHNAAIRILYNPKLYVLATPSCVLFLAYSLGLLFHNNEESSCSRSASEKIFSKAIYPLFLWFLLIEIVTFLKKWTKRQRPAYKDTSRNGIWIKNKKFPSSSIFLAKYNGNASFPSGDAASAAVFAIPVASLGGSPYYAILAWSMVVLACTGRMYVLAHHFSDVFVGALLSYAMHRVVSAIGLGIHDMQWWYPLLLTAAVVFHRLQKGRQKQRK